MLDASVQEPPLPGAFPPGWQAVWRSASSARAAPGSTILVQRRELNCASSALRTELPFIFQMGRILTIGYQPIPFLTTLASYQPCNAQPL